MRILTVNAGSSSLKLRMLEDEEITHSADLSLKTDELDPETVADALAGWPEPDVVGHRLVHGGTLFSSPVLITDEVRRQLQGLTNLAPLHQPKSLAGLDAVSQRLPDVPAVACFDTAFHTSIPDAAATYAIPAEWRDRGVRRYGFHGLSHAYASRRACELVGLPVDGSRVISCHLGAGASLCAVLDGRSVDTTMGFTPLEGLVMATRSGTVDPGMMLWLEEHENLSAAEVRTMLETRSGLLGLAGSKGFREVEAAGAAGDQRAILALDVHLHRLVAGICAMAGALGGLDVVVFTGGVGENRFPLRQRACDRLGWLGVKIDEERNAEAKPDVDLTSEGAAVHTVVITAREELQMAREIVALGRV